MMLVAVFSSVAAFRVFGEVYVLTDGTGGPGGGVVTMTMLIQREGTGLQARTGYAGASSLVMFVVLAVLLMLQIVEIGRASCREGGQGSRKEGVGDGIRGERACSSY